MSEAEKPVQCVCGQQVGAHCDKPWVKMGSTVWEVFCPNPKCLRRGPLGRSKGAATRLWNHDMRALKHFSAVVEKLKNAEYILDEHPSLNECLKGHCREFQQGIRDVLRAVEEV